MALSITRYVLFEKCGACPEIELLFTSLFNACIMQSDNRFPTSKLFTLDDSVVFEQDDGRMIFKFNLDLFWNVCMMYFVDYGVVQDFTKRIIKHHLGLQDYETRPLRSIFINQLNQEMWEASNPDRARRR